MTKATLTRRRVLNMSAALCCAGLSSKAIASAPTARWQGFALGAQAQIVLAGISQDEAAAIFAMVRDEIARLEGIFSLYQTQSSISRLNAEGVLPHPAPELLEVLSLSQHVWQASEGAFDPTVQRVWQARATGDRSPAALGDFGDIHFSAHEIVMKQGAALTLNGIAQGYITDRVALLMRAQGLRDLVVDAGEQRAMGKRADGQAWRLGVADPVGQIVAKLSLSDRALATSSPKGTVLPDGTGHIIDPRSGMPAQFWGTVSVAHDSAAVTDALSTAACCLDGPQTAGLLSQFDGASLVFRH